MAYDAETTERTVTRDRVMRLRDFLKTLPDERFDMSQWGYHRTHTCETAACIGGWANILFEEDFGQYHETGALLGLNFDEACALFEPDGWIDDKRFTTDQAVAVLDHYLAHGVIDWSVAK